MNGWSSYALQDFIPFTVDIYFRLLERMNETFWPLHLLSLSLGLAALWLAIKNRGRLACLLVAPVWVFVAFAFFFQRYAELNWAGSYIGSFFVAQAILFILIALAGKDLDNKSCKKPSAVIGIAIAFIGLIGWPFIALLTGGHMYQSEVFGIHAGPTVITTLGLSLIMFRGWALWLMAMIPALWLLFSGLTLWGLGIPVSMILFIVLAIGLIGLFWKSLEVQFV
ncbi:MAG: DUF6064 family protein [Methylophaga sp.]|nr:DUF6064 family protein [Methylophaga sp.]